MKKHLLYFGLLALAWLAGGSVMAHDGDHSYNTKGICTIEGCTDKYQAPAYVDDWYELRNAGNVEWMSKVIQANESAHDKAYAQSKFKMMNDIDFTGVTHTKIGQSETYKFDGTFDGQGYRITNLVMNEPSNTRIGFFGYCRGEFTVIRNIIIDKTCSFKGKECVAALIGTFQKAVTNKYPTIENCVNEANVTATDKSAAAFVGGKPSNDDMPRLFITNCINTGDIKVEASVSGNDCAAAIVANYNCGSGKGGNSKLTNCVNTGTVSPANGDQTLFTGSYRSYENCYNVKTGKMDNGSTTISWTTEKPIESGELCYKLNGDQSDIAWTQTLDGTQEYPLPVADGDQVYFANDTFCDGSVRPYSNYETGHVGHIINVEIGMCYVCHTQFQEPALVDGWYQLRNAGNVEWYSNLVSTAGGNHANAKMMNDIDFLSIENLHSPIGPNEQNKFNATFDGQGFRIKNMIINRNSENNIGFFGWLRGNNAPTTVKNLIIDASCSIHGNNRVGGITGTYQNGGSVITIENVINEANISANGQDAGGIFGGHESGEPTIIIKNVLNKGNVTSTNNDAYVGALCCYLGVKNPDSKIENFVNLGTIGTHKGGNIGRHNISGVTNLIDLSDTANKTQGTGSGLVAADVASGKLAWYLNDKDTQDGDAFYQTIGTDAYPMPFNSSQQVREANTGNYTNLTVSESAVQISSTDHLKKFAAEVYAGNTSMDAVLTTDLDFENGNCRIGTDTKAYCGTFQGGDHVISNFVVNNNEIFQGLFGYVTGGADISGLVFDNTCSIKCNARGAMIGGAKDGGTVKLTRLGNEGNVTTINENAAGIIGTDMLGACVLQIDQCYSTGTIVGGRESAQIAGWTGSSSLISSCWSCAEVTGVQSGREFSRYDGNNHDGQYVNCFTTYHETNGGLTYDTPAEDFASGKVAYIINKTAEGDIFRQTLGEGGDTHPVFDNTHGIVNYISPVGYTTQYIPTTDVEIPSGVEAYAGVINGSSIKLVARGPAAQSSVRQLVLTLLRHSSVLRSAM